MGDRTTGSPDQAESRGVEKAEEAENYRELADLNARLYIDRRAYEWKINFGLWTAVVLLTGFTLVNQAVLPDHLWLLVMAAYAIIFVIFCGILSARIQLGNARDKEWFVYYKRRAENISGVRPPDAHDTESESGDRPRDAKGERKGKFSLWWQRRFDGRWKEVTLHNAMWLSTSLVTLIILVLSVFMIYFSTTPTKASSPATATATAIGEGHAQATATVSPAGKDATASTSEPPAAGTETTPPK